MPDKIPIDKKLTQHVLDPSQDSHSCQLTTMGAHQCHMEGAHIGLTTAMPRDTLTTISIFKKKSLNDNYIILETALINNYVKLFKVKQDTVFWYVKLLNFILKCLKELA